MSASIRFAKKWKIFWLSLLAVAVLWTIWTVLLPLVKGNGVDRYTGLQRQMAEAIVDLSNLYKEPDTPLIPDYMYRVTIEDIHPVTQEEKEQYCKDDDPLYISNDPTLPRYYTVKVSKQYLLTPIVKTTNYVGCDPIDYIHVQVFGIPEELDERVRIYPKER